MLFLNHDEVARVIDMPLCRDSLESLFHELARGMGRMDMYVPSGRDAPCHRLALMVGAAGRTLRCSAKQGRCCIIRSRSSRRVPGAFSRPVAGARERRAGSMRITGIDIHPLRIPLKGGFRDAHDTRASRDRIGVRVRTDEGVTGTGNVDPDPGHSRESFIETLTAVEAAARHLRGTDPLNVSTALELMGGCVPRPPDARAALEMALFDVKGKAPGRLVPSLSGGQLRGEVRLNGWTGLVEAEEAALARPRLSPGKGQAGLRHRVRP